MTERTTVRLPDELIRRAKRKASAEGRTLTALIEDGLRLVLSERGAVKPQKRIMPPVSKASGGLRPGIDLNDSASLHELEDLDYLARQK
jgi:hypothetical protein